MEPAPENGACALSSAADASPSLGGSATKVHRQGRQGILTLVSVPQIGAYDQQVWEKSLEQADLNVRTPFREWNPQPLTEALPLLPLTEPLISGPGQQTQEDLLHQAGPH